MMPTLTIHEGDCRLYCGDAAVILPTLTGIDALITDPPYQLANRRRATTQNASAARGHGQVTRGMAMRARDWGDMAGGATAFDPAPLLGFPKVILFGAIHYASRLPESTAWLIWDKREGVASDDNADCEMAWSNLGGPARIHRQLWKGVCRRGEENISIGGAKKHPFQKPVALMATCLTWAKLGGAAMVCDPFMGSGSTGVACLRAGLRFIGIESDPVYFQVAAGRLKAEAQNQRSELALGGHHG